MPDKREQRTGFEEQIGTNPATPSAKNKTKKPKKKPKKGGPSSAKAKGNKEG